MVRYTRYVVIKTKDAIKYLSPTEREILRLLGEKAARGRYLDGKARLQCVVVESDWPEYEPTWAAIARRVDGGEKHDA